MIKVEGYKFADEFLDWLYDHGVNLEPKYDLPRGFPVDPRGTGLRVPLRPLKDTDGLPLYPIFYDGGQIIFKKVVYEENLYLEDYTNERHWYFGGISLELETPTELTTWMVLDQDKFLNAYYDGSVNAEFKFEGFNEVLNAVKIIEKLRKYKGTKRFPVSTHLHFSLPLFYITELKQQYIYLPYDEENIIIEMFGRFYNEYCDNGVSYDKYSTIRKPYIVNIPHAVVFTDTVEFRLPAIKNIEQLKNSVFYILAAGIDSYYKEMKYTELIFTEKNKDLIFEAITEEYEKIWNNDIKNRRGLAITEHLLDKIDTGDENLWDWYDYIKVYHANRFYDLDEYLTEVEELDPEELGYWDIFDIVRNTKSFIEIFKESGINWIKELLKL